MFGDPDMDPMESTRSQADYLGYSSFHPRPLAVSSNNLLDYFLAIASTFLQLILNIEAFDPYCKLHGFLEFSCVFLFVDSSAYKAKVYFTEFSTHVYDNATTSN